jgi:outer membrane biogenesis lipoprotein LolB
MRINFICNRSVYRLSAMALLAGCCVQTQVHATLSEQWIEVMSYQWGTA